MNRPLEIPPSIPAGRPVPVGVRLERAPVLDAPPGAPVPIDCRRHNAAHERCGRPVLPSSVPTNCTTCRLREVCLPVGLSGEELDSLDQAVYNRRRVARGARAFGSGDALESLYAIRLGSFKSSLHTADGREQVTGFHLPGELLGLDAIGGGRHGSDAVALEDSELCVVPWDRLEELANEFPRIGRNFHRVMSRELASGQGIMLLLGRMSAEERLAAFLLNLSQRWAALGYSASEFVLRMSRDDIGNYLGLKIETVSRMFSKLREKGLIEAHQRDVRILDAAGLERLVSTGAG